MGFWVLGILYLTLSFIRFSVAARRASSLAAPRTIPAEMCPGFRGQKIFGGRGFRTGFEVEERYICEGSELF